MSNTVAKLFVFYNVPEADQAVFDQQYQKSLKARRCTKACRSSPARRMPAYNPKPATALGLR